MKDIEKIIDEEKIFFILSRKEASENEIFDVLKKGREKKGLGLEEVGVLIKIKEPEHLHELFKTANSIKDEIYGERLVFFAPLYVSDFCVNDCDYCNFHVRNKTITRRKLTLEEVKEQTEYLINMGHKRLLLEFGEDPVHNPIDYVTDVIDTIYSTRTDKGNIRRVNVNIAATTIENYKRLKESRIGTYQLFQETYHRDTYLKLHHGPKSDYDRQITAHNRAFTAGLDDLGIGVLFGLYDWRFEVLALVQHAQYLDRKFGVGPHTISVPRFRPAPTVTYSPEYPVSDEDFLKLIAILRIAVPYTGMIISTRERPEIRKIAYQIGISQTSAGSVTTPGGYGKSTTDECQFQLSDTRPLQEVIKSVLDDNLLPSFCTACYRTGRTGERFMELSKPGEIHNFCRPNGLLTFAEYLEDFASNGIYEKGYKVIDFYLNLIENEVLKKKTKEKIKEIKQGRRDIYF
jgi:2-iminoacetate synthase